MPLERYRHLIPDWSAFMAAALRPEPTVVRVRTGRIGLEDLRERLGVQGFRTRVLGHLPGFLEVADGPCPVSFTLEHWAGLFYVQQASTGVAAPALAPGPGDRILDLCAAPGGKTTHLAEYVEAAGSVVASDVNEGRLRGLLGNVYRLGLANIMVVAADARDFPSGAEFDKVLVDAPCSGQGTLRRHGGRVPGQRRSFLRYVTRAQERILRRSIELTRPGGEILYVTCTFAPEENEAVVSRVLADAPVDVLPLDLSVPHAPGLTGFEGDRYDARMEMACRIYPHHFDSGGLFLVKLRKLGGAGETDRAGAGEKEGAGAGAWSPVPDVYPPDPAGPVSAATTPVAGWLERMRMTFDPEPAALERWRWLMRGRTAWAHTVRAWPVGAWRPGGNWRLISTGIRALEPGGGGWPRPTSDFLRMLGKDLRARRIAVDREALQALLAGEARPVAPELRGYVALEMDGTVLGRGSARGGELRSELSKSRAASLRDVLEARARTGP